MRFKTRPRTDKAQWPKRNGTKRGRSNTQPQPERQFDTHTHAHTRSLSLYVCLSPCLWLSVTRTRTHLAAQQVHVEHAAVCWRGAVLPLHCQDGVDATALPAVPQQLLPPEPARWRRHPRTLRPAAPRSLASRLVGPLPHAHAAATANAERRGAKGRVPLPRGQR